MAMHHPVEMASLFRVRIVRSVQQQHTSRKHIQQDGAKAEDLFPKKKL
jgi:hypothetical protein